MNCTHTDKPSMWSNAHVCADCFAKDFALQLGSVPHVPGRVGKTYEYAGPLLARGGKNYREQQWKN